jgi:hypothetical protein
VLLAAGALLAAVVRQVIAIFEPGGWSWTALFNDLVTNVFLAAIVGVVVEGSRRLAKQRSTARFVQQTAPLVRRAVLAWTGRLTMDTADAPLAATQRKLSAAAQTLRTIDEGLRDWARLGAAAQSDVPPPTVAATLAELERYVQNGGRGRRAVYARALLTELATARVEGDTTVASAASAFTWHATDWLALLERTDAAVRVIAAGGDVTPLALRKHGRSAGASTPGTTAGDPWLAALLASGTDPVVALLQSLDAGAPASPGSWGSAYRIAMQSLREEAAAGALCVADLQHLLEAASALDVAASESGLRPSR